MGSALHSGLTERRGVPGVALQLHDHNLGLRTATLPYTVRITRVRLSLWLSAPHRRQFVWPDIHPATCCETNALWAWASRARPSARVRPRMERLQSRARPRPTSLHHPPCRWCRRFKLQLSTAWSASQAFDAQERSRSGPPHENSKPVRRSRSLPRFCTHSSHRSDAYLTYHRSIPLRLAAAPLGNSSTLIVCTYPGRRLPRSAINCLTSCLQR